MDENPEIPDIPDAVSLTNVKGDVSFNSVTFGYDPGKVILKNISFGAKAGQKIATGWFYRSGKRQLSIYFQGFTIFNRVRSQ